MFDFVGAFKRGVKAAKDLNKHQLEVDEVFSELSSKFLEATNGEFTIERNSSLVSSASVALDVLAGVPPRSQSQASGAIIMRSMNDPSKKARLANWVRHPKGFTFVLQFEQREIISKSKAELGAALEELLSAPIVGKAYLSLLNSSQADDKERGVVAARPLRVVGGQSAKGAAVAAKPAAKPAAAKAAAKIAAKPAAAKAAAKIAAKPAAAKAAAKIAAKPAAAKAAAKVAAKPAAAKPAAKAAAKPAAKVAVKPAAKPAAAKPAAKPAVKPPAAKPAAPKARPAAPVVPNEDAFDGSVNEVKSGAPQNAPNPGLLN
jgi:hypothetical protein